MISLTVNELKKYIISSRFCNITNVCNLKANGSILFDLSLLGTPKECTVYVRCVSGNGGIIASSGEHVFEGKILSKTSQSFTINLAENQVLRIERPGESYGVIEILRIELNVTKEDIILSNKWKEKLDKCTDYKFITVRNNRLFASEGAFLKAESILFLETDPPNFYVLEDGIAKFSRSCEIIGLEVSGTPHVKNINYLPHISSAEKQYPTENPQQKQVYSSSIEQYVNPISGNSAPVNNILFDSMANQNFRGIRTDGNVVVTDHGVKINHKGSITIPVAAILPGYSYIVIVEVRNINGNGKFHAYISPSKDIKHNILFANALQRNVTSTIYSGYDGPFSVVVSRHPSSTGEIMVSRVILMANINAFPPTPIIRDRMLPAQNDTVGEIKLSGEFFISENDMKKVHGEYEMPKLENLKFAIVIPSYNNTQWTEKTLSSVFSQNKDNYRAIFIDDCSSDDTFDKANRLVGASGKSDKVTLIRNEKRMGALYNLYTAIHSCDDNEIIVTLDGDDWFAHDKVIEKLDSVYSNSNVWMSYGQYQSYPDNGAGCSRQIPTHITAHNAFRQYGWCSSHLRTFYAWLFKKIKKEDLLDKSGNFYPMAWDLSFMFGLLEMSGQHAVFIPDILYIYNVANPINDYKVNLQLQQALEREIRAKAKYDRV